MIKNERNMKKFLLDVQQTPEQLKNIWLFEGGYWEARDPDVPVIEGDKCFIIACIPDMKTEDDVNEYVALLESELAKLVNSDTIAE
ncbi:MAG: hypothetical protein QXV17_01595 [Candidatus Micrarchaeaceae archaeon]